MKLLQKFPNAYSQFWFFLQTTERQCSDWNFKTIYMYAAATAKLLQLCPTLCDPIDSSPPGSPVPGILQAGILERVAISFSSAWKWKVKVKSLSRVQLLATLWTAPTRLLRPWDLSGKSTGVGCHCLLQYIWNIYVLICIWHTYILMLS